MNKKISLIVLLIALVFVSGCTEYDSQPEPELDDIGATNESVRDIVNANNQFALELYSKYKSEEGNIFFSPYSISTALAMTYEGAKGKTAEEMQAVFHFPEDESVRRPAFAKIFKDINKKDKKYTLSTANALWAQKDYQFLDDYFSTVEKYYAGKVTNMDFVGETEKSRVTINTWVEENTNNKIKDLLPAGAITRYTRLVLTNAIYFKEDWVLQFDKKNTHDEDFKTGPSSTVKAEIMRLTGDDAKFNYAENEELQILEMPYSGEDLSMIVLLPKSVGLSDLEKSITLEKLSEWKSDMLEQRVDIYIPKFKFETKYFMKKDLSEMGMPTAFSDSADFSGMTGKKDLSISDVIHQAFVEVNEEGTEAAAATGVVAGITSVGPRNPIFRADHPFIFMIQEKATGNILFFGRVSDPTKS